MDCSSIPEKQQKHLTDILAYVKKSSGLRGFAVSATRTRVHQSIDGKFIDINAEDLDDVLFRSDAEGVEFLQVNFQGGHKILLTDTLVGFKPVAPEGVDLSKIPRVVTTPDVMNVFEAIQDSLHATGPGSQELTVLRRVYEAVLNGGEIVGFDLASEREWLTRIPSAITKLAS